MEKINLTLTGHFLNLLAVKEKLRRMKCEVGSWGDTFKY
jgi:hypothetical protein